ncbi:MAG: phenylalanine--tRNA ligase subunit beta [Candidatus Omnitrophota bacterium]
MKLSYNWIKDYIDIDVTPELLAEKLTMTGSEVGGIEEVNGDFVMELEITSNRPDCLNMLGLAREAAAIFGKDIKMPAVKVIEEYASGKDDTIEFEIRSPHLCPRYTARIIRSVKVRESFGRVSERLTSLGVRKVNNVVDITNFCLMESGQPMHAFDLDKIKGKKIEIRQAQKGEKITTIDGVERELKTDMLVIADKGRPIAIAGVMGGKDTEVTSGTKNILLESAYFDPVSIRRTSRVLGLSSDSSYRFERGVDKSSVKSSSDRAAALILEAAGGKAGLFYDSGPYGEDRKEIEIDAARVSALLGTNVREEEIAGILGRLGMETVPGESGKIKVSVPVFREDISRPADLVEEVARIYGYDRIPDTVPTPAPWSPRKSKERQVNEKIKKTLIAMGLNEIMTYSLISEKSAGVFDGLVKGRIKIMNPLSEEQGILTPHLVDGMLKAAAWNVNRGNKDLMFFETGKIYSRPEKKEEFVEMPVLSVGMTGNVYRNWMEGEKKADIYRLKGVLENMARHIRVEFCFRSDKIEGIKNAAAILMGNVKIGFLGEVAVDKLEIYGISQDVFVAQIELREVFKNSVLRGRYSPIPKFPSSSRDISVLCDKSVPAADIKVMVEKTGAGMVENVDITDMYEGKQIPSGKKSVTLSVTYGLAARTLTDQEVSEMHSRIKEQLSSKLKVTFR